MFCIFAEGGVSFGGMLSVIVHSFAIAGMCVEIEQDIVYRKAYFIDILKHLIAAV